jgi:hypothetical protein
MAGASILTPLPPAELLALALVYCALHYPLTSALMAAIADPITIDAGLTCLYALPAL